MHPSSIAKLLVALMTSLHGATVLAADCKTHTCRFEPRGSSRAQLYEARQHVRGDTTKHQTGGYYCVPGGGSLSWPGGNPQQVCWDAFEYVLEQCHPEGAGAGTHLGYYYWNGEYRMYGCEAEC